MKQVLSENYAVIFDRNARVISHPSTIYTNDDVELDIFPDKATMNIFISKIDIKTLPILKIGEIAEVDKLYNVDGKVTLVKEVLPIEIIKTK